MATKKRRGPAPAPNRVMGYVRVSTTEQMDGGVSLAQQRAAIESYAAAHGLSLAGIVEDGGVSASVPFAGRAGGRSVVEAIERGDVAAVVVTRLDRAYRSALDALQCTSEWASRGVGVVFVTQNIDTTTAVGKLLLTMLSAVAEMEKNLIAERTSAALQHLSSIGVTLGGDPLGRRRGVERDDAGRLVVLDDEHELLIVDRIVELRRDGGTLRAIAATLEAEGHKPKRGGARWAPSVIRSVLRRAAQRKHANDRSLRSVAA